MNKKYTLEDPGDMSNTTLIDLKNMIKCIKVNKDNKWTCNSKTFYLLKSIDKAFNYGKLNEITILDFPVNIDETQNGLLFGNKQETCELIC